MAWTFRRRSLWNALWLAAPLASRAHGGDLLTTLGAAGVLEAAGLLGIDVERVLAPLDRTVDHPYRHYRWCVGRDGESPVIHSLPPEEEMGWTPWERWTRGPRRASLVLYPLRTPAPSNGIPRWYPLDDTGLAPRFARPSRDLEDTLNRARIEVAASILGLNLRKDFLQPLRSSAREIYRQYRWAVIPHILAADGPVIYALPPRHRAHEWPWESWYTEGDVPCIHHVHFTARTSRTTGAWREYPGAPQRPPEIFGTDWYWYDDTSMTPALAQTQSKERL